MTAGENSEISVVVATRDREDRLAALLRSLEGQTLDPARFEIVIVDDASTDGTPALLRRAAEQAGPAIRPLFRTSRGGPARARNEGWREARAPLVAFTDDDCEAHAFWLEECVQAAERNPGSIIQGRTDPNPREIRGLGPFSHTRQVDGSGPWWFETCNIVYPRELLEAVGGFDETFPDALGEDTDLGWRAIETGARREFVATARVYHAVEQLSPIDHLRGALRGIDSVLVFRRHTGLRAMALRYGIVRNPAHLRMLLAAAGLWLSRRWLPMVMLAYPYLRLLGWRCRTANASRAYSPYLILYDLLTLITTLRGDLRHRVLII